MKTKRQRLEKKLDTVFSLYIRARDKKCCTPNKRFMCSDVLQCGHLFTRSDRSTRWDADYAFGQCSTHNMQHEYHPEIMTDWFVNKFGSVKYKNGVRLTSQVKKWALGELEDLIKHYESLLQKENH